MKPTKIVIAGFLLIACGLLLSPLADTLHYLFPAMALVTGLMLLRLSDTAYISFTLWIYFLTPLFRRLVDYRSLYLDPSPILLAPPLVTFAAVLAISRRMQSLRNVQYIPYLLVSAVILYGMLVGVCLAPGIDIVKNGILWLAPVIWGFYLVTVDQPRELIRRSVTTNLKWAGLLLGLYGMLQYVSIPAWDAVWLEHAIQDRESLSFGDLVTGDVRIWSTLNGPAVFAQFQAACFVMALADTGIIGMVSIAGGLAFLLAQVRAAWVGIAAGFACLLAWQPGRWTKLLPSFALAGLVVAGLASMPQFRDTVTSRIETLTALSEDGSFQERRATQERLLKTVVRNPFGLGVAAPIGKDTQGYPIDSGVFLPLVTLGWTGALVLWGSLAALVLSCFHQPSTATPLCLGFRAVLIAALAQLPFGDMYTGPPGFILWTAVGLSDLAPVPSRILQALHTELATRRWREVTLH